MAQPLDVQFRGLSRMAGPILGAHMSIAGGYYKAIEKAVGLGMSTCQIFTKNSNQWRAKEITVEEADRFRASLAESGVKHPISHDSYLINLASPDEVLWRRSIDAYVIEIQRAATLGLECVVTHPGSRGSLSEEAGLKRIVAALDEVDSLTRGLRVFTLLENTAGQGTSLGWRLEHLATILAGVKNPDRLAVCLDTCHLFAAGYPLASQRDYRSTIKQIEQTIGLKMVRAFHLNDSKRELGSRVDRHAKIGDGHLGLEPFRRLLNDRRFARVPMYLETPKGEVAGVELDAINLATLRGLVR